MDVKEKDEIRKRWAELGLTDDLKVEINENGSKLYEETDALPLVMQIASKTVGFDIEPTKFEDIGKKIQEIVEKCTKGKFTTNGANGITEQLVGYPTDKEDINA